MIKIPDRIGKEMMQSVTLCDARLQQS
jgi:hypothetical protein